VLEAQNKVCNIPGESSNDDLNLAFGGWWRDRFVLIIKLAWCCHWMPLPGLDRVGQHRVGTLIIHDGVRRVRSSGNISQAEERWREITYLNVLAALASISMAWLMARPLLP